MSVPASLGVLRAGLAASGVAESPPAAGRGGVGGPSRARRAAVLALLWSDAAAPEAGDLRVVAVEKTTHLRRHAGQVALPGGRIEPGESPLDAALREASEEVGVEASGVTVLGGLPPASVMASGYDVHPVVGWWDAPAPLRPVDLGEIAAVHQLAVCDLVDPANRATWVHPSGHSGPAFCIGDLFVWGLTGHLISGLLDLAGWSRPWDAGRRLEIPERFLRGRH